MCTSFRLFKKKATLGAQDIVVGRTLEFGLDLKSRGVYIPKRTKVTAMLRDPYFEKAFFPPSYVDPREISPDFMSRAKSWETNYNAVGTAVFNHTCIIDGINSQGLSCSSLYFPGYAEYTNIIVDNDNELSTDYQYLAPTDLGLFILSTFKSVEEVSNYFDPNNNDIDNGLNLRLHNTVLFQMGFPPPLHYVIHDAEGNCIVIEPTDSGRIKVEQNPIGVFANSPSFSWHLTNLDNYINITKKEQQSPVRVTGPVGSFSTHEIKRTGSGTGMLGLPGDGTSPSRFVRAAAYSLFAATSEKVQAQLISTYDVVKQAFHYLNHFDIPFGSVYHEVNEDNIEEEKTFWTSVMSLSEGRYYFHTFENSQVRFIDAKQDYSQITFFDYKGTSEPIDLANEDENSSTKKKKKGKKCKKNKKGKK